MLTIASVGQTVEVAYLVWEPLLTAGKDGNVEETH